MWKLQENILEEGDKEFLSAFIKRTDRFTQFEQVRLFEQKWSEWQGCKYSVFVNSGSSADLLMLDATKELCGILDNEEVIVPALTWVTNITSVIQSKLQPVFVDINLTDLSFDYDNIEKNINSKTKIILVTHVMGFPADMNKLKIIANKHNLIILEDCCESHGATYENVKVGNFGLASTFSFYWGHHITSIEGGMICTNDEKLYDLLLLKKSHGLARELDKTKHDALKKEYPNMDFNFLFLTHGYNVRNTELNAVVGISQLGHLDRYIEIRNKNYEEFLKITIPLRNKLHVIDVDGVSSFCFPFIFRNAYDRYKYQTLLEKYDVETRPIIGGNLLRQPCFNLYGNPCCFKNAEIAHQYGFYIGNNQFVNSDRMNLLKSYLYDKS